MQQKQLIFGLKKTLFQQSCSDPFYSDSVEVLELHLDKAQACNCCTARTYLAWMYMQTIYGQCKVLIPAVSAQKCTTREHSWWKSFSAQFLLLATGGINNIFSKHIQQHKWVKDAAQTYSARGLESVLEIRFKVSCDHVTLWGLLICVDELRFKNFSDFWGMCLNHMK